MAMDYTKLVFLQQTKESNISLFNYKIYLAKISKYIW